MSDTKELSMGWAKARVDSLVRLVNGFAFKPTQWESEGLPIIRIQNLNNPDAPFNYCSEDLPDKIRVRNGDLLFAWSGTPGTSFGAHIWRGDDAWLNQHIFKVIFDREQLDERFLRLAINQNLDSYIRQAHGGAGLAHITKGRFEESELSIAPLNEQRRIVAKIEELFSDLEVGVAALTRARANLKRYRASVLKAAVEGALTAEWRTQHPQVEPASKLLARILTERRRQWEADQLAKFAAAGKQPPNNWQAKYAEPAPPDTTNLPTLPNGWCWASVGRLLIAPTCNGISIKGRNEPPGVAALRLNAMTDCGFNYSARRYIDISDELANDLAIRRADFFVSRGNGSLHLVGRGTLAQEPGERVVFPDTMIRLRIAEPPVLPRFIGVIWASRLLRRQIETTARTTAGIYKISQADVESFVVPLPPLAEQSEIVATVSEKLSQIESAEVAIEHSLRRAARLRQSILKQAFEGKLVPQDPTDEPASTLLERLRTSAAETSTMRTEPTTAASTKNPRTPRRSKPQSETL